MATAKECKRIERELEEALEEYNRENAPCANTGCTFHSDGKTGHCSWYHYWADDCREYIAES